MTPAAAPRTPARDERASDGRPARRRRQGRRPAEPGRSRWDRQEHGPGDPHRGPEPQGPGHRSEARARQGRQDRRRRRRHSGSFAASGGGARRRQSQGQAPLPGPAILCRPWWTVGSRQGRHSRVAPRAGRAPAGWRSGRPAAARRDGACRPRAYARRCRRRSAPRSSPRAARCRGRRWAGPC